MPTATSATVAVTPPCSTPEPFSNSGRIPHSIVTPSLCNRTSLSPTCALNGISARNCFNFSNVIGEGGYYPITRYHGGTALHSHQPKKRSATTAHRPKSFLAVVAPSKTFVAGGRAIMPWGFPLGTPFRRPKPAKSRLRPRLAVLQLGSHHLSLVARRAMRTGCQPAGRLFNRPFPRASLLRGKSRARCAAQTPPSGAFQEWESRSRCAPARRPTSGPNGTESGTPS